MLLGCCSVVVLGIVVLLLALELLLYVLPIILLMLFALYVLTDFQRILYLYHSLTRRLDLSHFNAVGQKL